MAAQQAAGGEEQPFSAPDVAGTCEQEDRHKGGSNKQEDLESIRVRQIVSKQKEKPSSFGHWSWLWPSGKNVIITDNVTGNSHNETNIK